MSSGTPSFCNRVTYGLVEKNPLAQHASGFFVPIKNIGTQNDK
jgi:hypothetical protein